MILNSKSHQLEIRVAWMRPVNVPYADLFSSLCRSAGSWWKPLKENAAIDTLFSSPFFAITALMCSLPVKRFLSSWLVPLMNFTSITTLLSPWAQQVQNFAQLVVTICPQRSSYQVVDIKGHVFRSAFTFLSLAFSSSPVHWVKFSSNVARYVWHVARSVHTWHVLFTRDTFSLHVARSVYTWHVQFTRGTICWHVARLSWKKKKQRPVVLVP